MVNAGLDSTGRKPFATKSRDAETRVSKGEEPFGKKCFVRKGVKHGGAPNLKERRAWGEACVQKRWPKVCGVAKRVSVGKKKPTMVADPP